MRIQVRSLICLHFADCVGPQSEQAGKASGCEGCPSREKCSSGAFRKPDPGMECV